MFNRIQNECPTVNCAETAKRLRFLMKQRKITVKDVQKYLNLSCVQSIYHWLNGSSMPSLDNLYALSELFQVPLDSMVCGNRQWDKDKNINPHTKRIALYYEMLYDKIAA